MNIVQTNWINELNGVNIEQNNRPVFNIKHMIKLLNQL